MGLPIGTCLQCEQTREQVKRYETICGIEEGYEYRELAYEWPKHHWRDWSDAELKRAGVKPEFYDLYRRDSISTLGYVACDHHERGHNFAKKDVYFDKWLMHEQGVCMDCGKRKEPADV